MNGSVIPAESCPSRDSVAMLKVAAAAVAKLEAAESDAGWASLLAGIRDVAEHGA